MVSPELLRRYSYFAPIRHETLKKVAMISQEKVVAAGQIIFREWERADHLYVVLKGEVSVGYPLPTGEDRPVDTLGEGDLMVWSALVPPYRTTGSGTTTKETHLVVIEAAKLRELCDEDPQLGFRLMTEVVKVLSQRLEGTRAQLAVA